MQIVAKTDIGLKRSTNQDNFKISSDTSLPVWAVVCDGMGGMAAGNVASQTAVQLIEKSLSDNLSPSVSESFICNLLKSSVLTSNAAIYDMACSDENFKGMGTTVVAVIIKDNIAYIAHAGDSRAYLYHNGSLKQITTDHSIVQSMVDNGQLTEDEARNHPNKNIITRAVGVRSEMEVDLTKVIFETNDTLLLCTDGLTNCVDDLKICEILGEADLEKAARRLIDTANANGGIDNITIAAFRNN